MEVKRNLFCNFYGHGTSDGVSSVYSSYTYSINIKKVLTVWAKRLSLESRIRLSVKMRISDTDQLNDGLRVMIPSPRIMPCIGRLGPYSLQKGIPILLSNII